MSAQSLPRIFLSGLCVVPLVTASQANGATVTNLDADLFIFTVTENGDRTEIRVRTGETRVLHERMLRCTSQWQPRRTIGR